MPTLLIHGVGTPGIQKLVEGVAQEFLSRGYTLDLIRREEPRPYRRKSQGTLWSPF